MPSRAPIQTLESLREHLQWAIELEHSTIPPYLCALYSLDPARNPEAVEVVTSVFVEEMLHMTLAANLLNAVGGRPVLDAPHLMPGYPSNLPHGDRSFEVSLVPFGAEALELFLKIEQPSTRGAPAESDSYETIGQFYEAIELGFRYLCERLGEDSVFCGDPERQVTSTLPYHGGGNIIAVSDLLTALGALEEIVEQGEGIAHHDVWDGDHEMFHPERDEVAHYYRFQELRLGRRYQRGDTPQSGPTGDPFKSTGPAYTPCDRNPRRRTMRRAARSGSRRRSSTTPTAPSSTSSSSAFNGSPRLLVRGHWGDVRTEGPGPGADADAHRGRVGSGRAHLRVRRSVETALERGRLAPHRRPAERALPGVRAGTARPKDQGRGSGERRIPGLAGRPRSLETEETFALCRCGESRSKPFCDGSHARLGFDGAETATTDSYSSRMRRAEGTGISVRRVGSLCMHAAFCVGRARQLDDLVPETSDTDTRAHVMWMVDRCPSGSYTYALEPDDEALEPDLPVAISVIEEEHGLASGLWVTGGIPIHRADGKPWEDRNRVMLCRCGASGSKPLCDGTHREVDFRE